jgi:hypothetical protein
MFGAELEQRGRQVQLEIVPGRISTRLKRV